MLAKAISRENSQYYRLGYTWHFFVPQDDPWSCQTHFSVIVWETSKFSFGHIVQWMWVRTQCFCCLSAQTRKNPNPGAELCNSSLIWNVEKGEWACLGHGQWANAWSYLLPLPTPCGGSCSLTVRQHGWVFFVGWGIKIYFSPSYYRGHPMHVEVSLEKWELGLQII